MFLEENAIYHGRSEVYMKRITPESVSLSFWSPPYFLGKDYEIDETYESWQEMLKKVIELHYLVLKPGGFMIINIADILCFKDNSIPKFQAMNVSNQKSKVTREMVLEAKKANPNYSRQQLAKILGCSEQTVDRRLNGNNIRGGKYEVQTRVKLVGSSLEKYAYDCGLYLYDKKIWVKDPAWANSKWTNNSLKGVHEYEDLYVFWKPGQQIIDRNILTNEEWKEWGSRSVWYINSVRKNNDHSAKFPIELAERIIKLYSKSKDLILDPFIGSGTTALAAIKHKRNYIGIDKELKYYQLAQQSIYNYNRQIEIEI